MRVDDGRDASDDSASTLHPTIRLNKLWKIILEKFEGCRAKIRMNIDDLRRDYVDHTQMTFSLLLKLIPSS
jgi:hypothetical protein